MISGAESLAKRIFPGILATSTLSTATAISLSLTNGEDVTIGVDRIRLTYDTSSGDALAFGGGSQDFPWGICLNRNIVSLPSPAFVRHAREPPSCLSAQIESTSTF